MSFWRRLRWTATIAFIALVVLSWIGTDGTLPSHGGSGRPLHTAPQFHP